MAANVSGVVGANMQDPGAKVGGGTIHTKKKDDPARVHEAAQQFESFLIAQMLKSMRGERGHWSGNRRRRGGSLCIKPWRRSFRESPGRERRIRTGPDGGIRARTKQRQRAEELKSLRNSYFRLLRRRLDPRRTGQEYRAAKEREFRLRFGSTRPARGVSRLRTSSSGLSVCCAFASSKHRIM